MTRTRCSRRALDVVVEVRGAVGPFGSEDYSREELIAEMGAAFLCGQAGIEVKVVHHASYIGSWLKSLGDDPKLVVQAAAAATKAAHRILGEQPETTVQLVLERVRKGRFLKETAVIALAVKGE